MSTEKNVQVVKDFFTAIGSGDKQARSPWSLKTLSGSFRAKTGRWRARTAGTQELRQRFGRPLKKWK